MLDRVLNPKYFENFQGNEDYHVTSSAAPKHIVCEEDDEFVAMFDKMLNGNIAESRTVAANRAGGQQVPPAQGRSGKKNYGKIFL